MVAKYSSLSQIGSKSTEEGTGWLVEREELNKNENGFMTKVTQVWLLVQDEKVKQNLRQCLHNDNRMLEKVLIKRMISCYLNLICSLI